MLKRLSAQISRIISRATRMTEAETSGVKRLAEELGPGDQPVDSEPTKKKSKQEDAPAPMQGRIDRKRKVVLLLAYCGKGFYGIQRNPGFNTIEEELLKALLACELIPQDHFDCPQKMSFQRAARTDKGVSAVGNLVSLKCFFHYMLLNQENLLQNINDKLPPQIRVVGMKRATKAFNSKNQCGGRTYAYMTPTYAFAPFKKFITEEYRTTDEEIKEVNRILSLYKGTRNFHNFTSGRKPNDPSAKRYIISFECGKPFVRDGIEFAIMRVRGQSFMLHHIRKMIGLMIAIMKGYCGTETLDKTWQPEKVDVPKAPGVGLMLEQLHYDGYNRKFGRDGMHEAIEWPDCQEVLDKFKEEHIYTHIIQSEKEEKTMLKWLGTLHLHKFDMKEEGEDPEMWSMMRRINKERRNSQENTERSDRGANCAEDLTSGVAIDSKDKVSAPSDENVPQSDTEALENTNNKTETETVTSTPAGEVETSNR